MAKSRRWFYNNLDEVVPTSDFSAAVRDRLRIELNVNGAAISLPPPARETIKPPADMGHYVTIPLLELLQMQRTETNIDTLKVIQEVVLLRTKVEGLEKENGLLRVMNQMLSNQVKEFESERMPLAI